MAAWAARGSHDAGSLFCERKGERMSGLAEILELHFAAAQPFTLTVQHCNDAQHTL